jgi:hypothetical protein
MNFIFVIKLLSYIILYKVRISTYHKKIILNVFVSFVREITLNEKK